VDRWIFYTPDNISPVRKLSTEAKNQNTTEMKKLMFVALAGLGILAGCSKSSSIETYTPTCDGTVKSYSANVAPILQNACSGCHSNLSTYSQVFANRFNVRSAIVSGAMPRGGSLTTDQKNAIVCWIDNGAANN
jgi:uncharacterized membrane protein